MSEEDLRNEKDLWCEEACFEKFALLMNSFDSEKQNKFKDENELCLQQCLKAVKGNQEEGIVC